MKNIRILNNKKYLVALWVIFLILKLAATFYYFKENRSIDEIGFGFGGYINNLRNDFNYIDCSENICLHSSRMPLIPLFYSALSKISTQQLIIGLLKNILMSLYFFAAFFFLIKCDEKIYKKTISYWSTLITIWVLLPPIIKHATQLTYEEGLLIEWAPIWTFSFLLSTKLLLTNNIKGKYQIGCISLCILQATLMLATKSSLILITIASFILGLMILIKTKSKFLIAIITICSLCLIGWAYHNKVNSNHFTIMTSQDGSNLHRGHNSISYLLYPDISLDRIYETDLILNKNGEAIETVNFPPLKYFKSEWDWNDYYRKLALDWAFKNPKDEFNFTLKKITNFFISINRSPSPSIDEGNNFIKNIENYSIIISIVIGRLLELLLILLIITRWIENKNDNRAIIITIIIANLAYAIPYIIGFNYERHITVYFTIVGVSFIVLLSNSKKHILSTN